MEKHDSFYETATNPDDNHTHFTTDNIVETLQNMEVINIKDQVSVPAYAGSQISNTLHYIFPIGPKKKGCLPEEPNKILRDIKQQLHKKIIIHYSMQQS